MLTVNKIYFGDCLNIMDNIPNKSINLIICDPPFGVTAQTWDTIIDFKRLWYQFKRCISDEGTVIIFSAQPFTTQVINSNIQNFKYCWYWVKNQGTNFYHAHRMPIRKVEDICIFYSKKYFPQKTTKHPPTNSCKGSSTGKVYFGENKRNYKGGETTRFPTNVLNFKCVNNYHRLHPNEKPIELISYLIKTYTKKFDIVLDPCCGSGSVGESCLSSQRNFLLIEKERQYFNTSFNRLKGISKEIFEIHKYKLKSKEENAYSN